MPGWKGTSSSTLWLGLHCVDPYPPGMCDKHTNPFAVRRLITTVGITGRVWRERGDFPFLPLGPASGDSYNRNL